MVRFLVLYDPPADPAAFERHYFDVHIPLAEKLPGLRRYTIGRGITPIRGGDPYHLVGELEWDDMAAVRTAFESPEGQATAADVAELATGGVRSMIFEAEEVFRSSGDAPEADAFAAEWIAAWNARDLDAVLAHYAPDVVFTSPLAERFAPGTEGIVRGKDALRDYWTTALAAHPDLHFELVGAYAGVETIALNYRNQAGGLVCEVLTFRGGLVAVGHATALTTPTRT